MNANMRGIRVIYLFEMARFGRTFWTSLLMPVVTTSLYFVVFGSAIGSRMTDVSSVPYGPFTVPGLMLPQTLPDSIRNTSLGTYTTKRTGRKNGVITDPTSALQMAFTYVRPTATTEFTIRDVFLPSAPTCRIT